MEGGLDIPFDLVAAAVREKKVVNVVIVCTRRDNPAKLEN